MKLKKIIVLGEKETIQHFELDELSSPSYQRVCQYLYNHCYNDKTVLSPKACINILLK